MSLEIGDVIDGKYKIVRLLGEGGMGAVYEGENVRIHRRVAIKILHANVASSKDAVQRFEREAQAAGRIGSEHIVEVLDLGELPDGDRFMVMEYLDGEALNDRIARLGKLPPRQSASMMVDMLDGLKAAHEAGIIHRDLKPDNVFLLTSRAGKKDFVKVVDFGISKFSTLGGEFSMTQTGAVMGTPYYLSPEQAKGERNVDQRSDIYACGVILWEASVGRVPFDGETFNELMFKIVLEPVPDLSEIEPELDPDFALIVKKAMARDPAERFESAEAMQSALRAWLQGQPVGHELALGDGAVAPLTAAAQTVAGPGNQTVRQTHGNWAHTTPQVEEKKSRSPLIAAAAALLLTAGGGALYASNVSQAKEEAAAQAEAEREEQRIEREREQAAEIARLEAERAKAEARRAQAERERTEAEKERAKAQLSAAEHAAQLAREEQERQEQEEEERRRAAAARRAAARASSAQPKRPAPAPSPAQSAGRKIRTDL